MNPELKKRRHIMFPDAQVKPNVPLNHMIWEGKYMAEMEPDVSVDIGDFNDNHALSFWDKGKVQFEGRRVEHDLEAVQMALELRYGTAAEINPAWYDSHEAIITQGNHEYREELALQQQPNFIGLIDTVGHAYVHYFDQIVDFGDSIIRDGVAYSHFFSDTNTGKPMTGMMTTKLRKMLGQSFVAGHAPGFEYAELQNFVGKTTIGIVAGSGYLHFEDYKKQQGNTSHWRGILVLNEVHDGSFDLMKVSMDYLCRKYEGVTLQEFANKPEMWVGYGEMDTDSMKWCK